MHNETLAEPRFPARLPLRENRRVRKIVVVASVSGNGKTTLGRRLADRLDVPLVELDALVHGPGWAETPNDELRARLEPLLRREGWVAGINEETTEPRWRRRIG